MNIADSKIAQSALALVVITLIGFGLYWLTKPSGNESSSASQTGMTQNEPDSLSRSIPNEANLNEFDERVLLFEEAYHTLDPVRRSELMTPLATPEYMKSDALRMQAVEQFDGPTVTVLRGKDEYTINVEPSSDDSVRYVSTIVYVEKRQGDKLISSSRVEIPHETTWVRSSDGQWFVAKETKL